ncbi:hypothetical protein BKP37_10720 [Anaerobacillus alkalilacustris]|uniref:Gamma-glutamylcyclotransferase family protein n=1 Tax=Anaerobacillus alkalilacustris TaxID=393763 RepID=A0A1S2LP59_9BACI|nr:gamma-glutamylcyclotransferase family protein [Anaerobacillus alkalilacustris]OIJ13437.1 hypothetical protein BKP37_10720 [Anaerobacillus alkalilacustris]
MLLFVYGTLRKALENSCLLTNAKVVADIAYTNGVLFQTKYGYPAMLQGDLTVYGELYEITENMLPKLDELEDYVEGRKINLYERKTQTVFTNKNKFVAMVYILSNHKKDIVTKQIINGDWKEYIQSKMN